MILIFGGTTEGRAAVKVVEGSGKPYLYSTLTATQQIATPGGMRLTGALSAAGTVDLCRQHGVRLIIDAAHPFAEGVHGMVAEAAGVCGVPVVRYERRPASETLTGDVIWCDDWDDAVTKLETAGVRRLLALTGVRTIPKLRRFWERHECRFRILDRPESIVEAVGYGFPREGLIFYRAGEPEIEVMRRELSSAAGVLSVAGVPVAASIPVAAGVPTAVLTKESGEAGGFPEKVAAAHELGIPLYVVRRPAIPAAAAMSAGFHIVYTEAGLRRRIEELVPGWFPLRGGYTTGTCATAAACAALQGLLTGEELREVAVTLPGGERVVLPVERMAFGGGDDAAAEATVIKDAGDDPDVTNGAEITARVALTDRGGLGDGKGSKSSGNGDYGNKGGISGYDNDRNESMSGGIRFLQGEGVGRVTLPGLGLEVGQPAINPAPRRMIRDNFAALGIASADVTISVKDGAELAKKTFNPRLGIVGGISIIGTSGIVQPFSDEAFVEAIGREVAVAWALGCRRLVINSGAKSEAAVRGEFPELPPQAFVHYGNFIGETLRTAARAGFTEVAMGVMIGKAVKLAEGHLDTHSRNTRLNREFLADLAAAAGCSPAAGELIGRMILARELWTGLTENDRELFMPALLAACHAHLAPLLPGGRLSMMLITDEGGIACRI